MAFEFLSNLDTTTLFLLLIIFILFIVSVKKVFSMFVRALWIAVISVLFPIFMNRFLGYDIPMDPDSLISFMLLGLGVYFAFLVGRALYKVLGMAEKATKKLPLPEKSEAKHKEDKYDKREEKEDKKALKAREKELAQKEKELREREKQVLWKSAVEHQKAKSRGYSGKDYVVLEDPDKKVKPKPKETEWPKARPAAAEPLPVIEKPRKRKKNK